MNKEFKVKKELLINADITKVWDAIVNPEIVKQYFFGTQVESEWKVGSPIIFSGAFDGKSYRDKGTILAIENEKTLQYDYWSGFSGLEDKPENYSLVTYILQDIDGAVFLTLTQQGFANEQAHQHAVQGWEMVLNGMKELLEKR
jgi:uncharacterized protein YndB with AHSA1/START domain